MAGALKPKDSPKGGASNGIIDLVAKPSKESHLELNDAD